MLLQLNVLSNDGKKMEKYGPSAGQKIFNAAPLKWYLKNMARDFLVNLIENVSSDDRLRLFYYNYGLGKMTNIKPGFSMDQIT